MRCVIIWGVMYITLFRYILINVPFLETNDPYKRNDLLHPSNLFTPDSLDASRSCQCKGLRLGILGTASIAQKQARIAWQVEHHNLSLVSVTAVASRTPAKAKWFAEKQLPYALETYPSVTNSKKTQESSFQGYKELLASSNVDAVYIPLPTTLHKTWVMAALRAGKHVLLEKPVALNVQDWLEMAKEARRRNLHIQDGTMMLHHPRTHKFSRDMKAIMMRSTSSVPFELRCNFSYKADKAFFKNNIRTMSGLDPLGVLGATGWYCLSLGLLLFSPEEKTSSVVVTSNRTNDQGVLLSLDAEVQFGSQRKLVFRSNFFENKQYAELVGANSQVVGRMVNFVLQGKKYAVALTDLKEEGPDLFVPCPNDPEGAMFTQEQLMWRTFAQVSSCGRGGEWKTQHTGELQGIVDDIMKEVLISNSKM